AATAHPGTGTGGRRTATPGVTRSSDRTPGAVVDTVSRGPRTPFTGMQFPRLSLPPLRQQSLRKIYSLREFRHLVPQRFHRLQQLLPLPAVARPRLVAQPLGERLPDRRDREEEERATPEQEDDRENALDVHTQRGGARRSGSRSRASRRSVKSRRSSISDKRRLSSSTSASRFSDAPRTAPCFAAC